MLQLKSFFNFSSAYQNNEKIILRDYLSLERTKLANERTLMSYIRSAFYLLLTGIALIQLDDFKNIKFLGYISFGLAFIALIIGIYRFRKLNKQLMIFYDQIKDLEKN
ncbi:DUF202 domain-containing protein [Flavobacterium sp. GA093]|uniref:DUF202 domain-containing protein n=1 Tax=Flavobacterium hydrocarbonoxydans TaxID=2683249 RepID=A0A6I4P0K0_9FLAO|nr:DUF202 domain-containing protein [Flavobacterium hydrocarbonoxydans]MWB96674.1 DUF202 domain-containing protein [Flavobacterium hydrocarbonoxydans]